MMLLSGHPENINIVGQPISNIRTMMDFEPFR